MVTQFALCHVGSHLLLFIFACIWRAKFGAPRRRSLLRKQQRNCSWTPSLVSSTLVPPIIQTRTDVQSSLAVCPTALFFLLSQPSKCPVSHTTLAKKIYPIKFPFHNAKPNLASDITTASDTLRFANRSLVGLGTNYVGAQSQEEMANGAFNFDIDAVDRRAAYLCLMDIQKNFNGQLWVQNGPWVILRVLQMLCGTNLVSVHLYISASTRYRESLHFRTEHICVSCHDHN